VFQMSSRGDEASELLLVSPGGLVVDVLLERARHTARTPNDKAPGKKEVISEASSYLLMRKFLENPSRRTRETPPRAVRGGSTGHAATLASLGSCEKACKNRQIWYADPRAGGSVRRGPARRTRIGHEGRGGGRQPLRPAGWPG